MRALITGGGGQLASDLRELIEDCVALSRAELDVTDDQALRRAFANVRPEVVFNCAAFHNVEVCETEENRAFAVNARAVKRLAQLCAESGARLVHYSTNYVFDGCAKAPYGEDDRPNPRSVYAISKLAGEYAAIAYSPGALVVRSAGLYGLHGSASKGGNFVTRMIARARDHGARRDRGGDRAGGHDDHPWLAGPPPQRGARAPAGGFARPRAAASLARGARRVHEARRAAIDRLTLCRAASDRLPGRSLGCRPSLGALRVRWRWLVDERQLVDDLG